VQSSHAVADFIFQHKDVANVWHNISNYIIILSVPNEAELHAAHKALSGLNISLTKFNEPDIGNELTAIALIPNDEAEIYCRNLKLAFRKEDMLNNESIKEQYKNTKKKLNKYRRQLNGIYIGNKQNKESVKNV
jgi:hypothetical protein